MVQGLNHPEESVRLLTETGADEAGVSSLGGIRVAIGKYAQRVTERDVFFVYLIGHGNYRRGAAKPNFPGSDLSADDLAIILEEVSAGRIVGVNAASTIAALINFLSGDGRIFCTRYEERGRAQYDQGRGISYSGLRKGQRRPDRDDRVSVLEICQQASSLT